jgi:hypothetical protein
MVSFNTAHGSDRKQLLQTVPEIERQKQLERDAHKRNLDEAYRAIEIFRRNISVFKKHRIAYCLDKEYPPFAPTICLFRKDRPYKPEMIFIPVFIGGPHGTFSLKSLIKQKKREPLAWATRHIKYYDERHTRLSDDPQEAASEIFAKILNGTIEFNSLWEFDGTMGKCARRYFALRRAVLGLGFVAALAAVLAFLVGFAHLGR